jgi:xylulokinase
MGIDMGTGSTKGVLADLNGTIRRVATRSHQMSMPRPGFAEMDAETLWWREICEISAELLDGWSGTLEGVSVSGLGPSLVVTGDDLRPLRPAILYGIDMRATAEITELTSRFGADTILDRCGKDLSSQAVGPKMRWIQKNEPAVWEQTTRWFSAHSYIVAKLTGEYTLDHHTASQYDPLYDINHQDWATDWVGEVSPGVELPKLFWSSDVVGNVHRDAAAATGIPQGTPVCAGTVDAWAEAFSAGARRPGDLMLMYGSTMFFVEVLDSLAKHSGLWTTSGVEPGSRTLAAGMATSGSLTGWIQDLCGGAPFGMLVEEAAATPPGSDGLLLLPYFAGERTPLFDPDARGVVAGLTLRHRRGHLFRAAYEGIAFGIRQIVDFYEEVGAPPKRLIAVGGGTQGGLWTQIVTDVTNREQVVPDQTIGASLGDALLAAIGAGLVPPETDWSQVSVRITPDPRHHDLYEALYADFRALYPGTRDIVHNLASIQHAGLTARHPMTSAGSVRRTV